MAPEEVANWYRRQSITWLFFECLLPGVLFGMIWCAAEFFMQGIEQPFLSVFSTADLTVYAALLCLGVFKQFDEFISRESINEKEFHWEKMIAFFFLRQFCSKPIR